MEKLCLKRAEEILKKMEKAVVIIDCETGEVLKTNACADRLFCNHNQHRCFSK